MTKATPKFWQIIYDLRCDPSLPEAFLKEFTADKIKMEPEISTKVIECPICCKPIALSGHSDYHAKSCRFKTPIYYCNNCDIFYRDVESLKLVAHFYAASYTQKKNEEHFFLCQKEVF